MNLIDIINQRASSKKIGSDQTNVLLTYLVTLGRYPVGI